MMVLKSLFVPSCTNNQYCPRAAQSRNVHKSGAAAGSGGQGPGWAQTGLDTAGGWSPAQHREPRTTSSVLADGLSSCAA